MVGMIGWIDWNGTSRECLTESERTEANSMLIVPPSEYKLNTIQQLARFTKFLSTQATAIGYNIRLYQAIVIQSM